MLRFCILFLFIFLSINELISEIKFITPVSGYKGCSNQSILITWNSSQPVFLLARTENDNKFEKIFNESISGGEYLWSILDAKYFNIPIKLKVINVSDTNDADEIVDVFIYQPTEIIEQSQSDVYCQGEDLHLMVDANGYNIKYQWYRDDIILENENQKILTLNNVDFEHSAVYECLVIGDLDCNTIKSQPIAVYVAAPTAIISHPQHQGWKFGGKAKFSVDVHINGDYGEDIKFEWYKGKKRLFNGDGNYSFLKDKNRISGAHTHEIVFNFLLPKDSTDSIYCVVTGRCGSVKSKFAKLQEDVFFSYDIPQQEILACVGNPTTISINVTQNEPGTLLYQWFRSGNKMLIDDDRISGTTTNNLTINRCVKSDLGVYYLRIAHKESGFFDNTSMISLYTESDPNLITDLSDYTIYNRENGTHYYGKIHLMLGSLLMLDTLLRKDKYYFEWYKNDSLFHQGYGLNGAEIKINNPTILDEGIYYCIINGKCGITYSDTFNIFLGYKDILTCEGSDTVLTARKHRLDKGQMKYFWQFKNYKLQDIGRYEGTSTLSLKVKSITTSQQGVYYLYAIDTILNQTYSNGFIYLDVASEPKVLREYFPSSINIKKGHAVKMMSVVSKNSMKIELFKEGNFITSRWFSPLNWTDTEYTFFIGCSGPNCVAGHLESGNYKFKFTNDCGEIWSREFTVNNIDSANGIVYNPDLESETDYNKSDFDLNNPSEYSDIEQINEFYTTENTNIDYSNFTIFPNPASDYITISIGSIGAGSNENNIWASPNASIEIYDVMGVLIHSTPSASQPPLNEGNLKIDISNLSPGVYFVKIVGSNGACSIVEKFVKM